MRKLAFVLALVVLVAPAAHAGPLTKAGKYVAVKAAKGSAYVVVHAAKGVAKVGKAVGHVAGKL